MRVDLSVDQLQRDGFTNVVLGASDLTITLIGQANGATFARSINLRGMTPLGGPPAKFN